MDDILGDGGILKEVVQAGDGPPVPQNASVLSISRTTKIEAFYGIHVLLLFVHFFADV